MSSKIEKEIRFLKAYAIIATLICGVFIVSAFTFEKNKKFKTIDVERINVVEKDGTLRLVISNLEKSPDPVFKGKSFPGVRKNRAGFIFYTEEGDEIGGLGFQGREENGKVRSNGGLSFDQYQQDQVIGISASEDNGQRTAGLQVWDRPEFPLSNLLEPYLAYQKMPDGAEKTTAGEKLQSIPQGVERIFIGKKKDKSAVINLADTQGKTRLRIFVNSDGKAKIDFLDENGKITDSLPNPVDTTEK